MSKQRPRRKSFRKPAAFSRQGVLDLLEQPDRPSLTAKALLRRLGGDPRQGSALHSLLAEMVAAGELDRQGRRFRVQRKPASKRQGGRQKRIGRQKQRGAAAVEKRLVTPATRRLAIGILVLLAINVGVAYYTALDGEFLNWDDNRYVTQNQHIRSLSWGTVRWAFTSFHSANWHPLTWISLAIDYRVFGLEPWGYHLTSVLLHIANTCLLFLVLFSLSGAVWKSAVAAAFFGLHPTHVESVAWIAERKDVLSTLFWFLTIAAYTRFTRTRNRWDYLLVVLAFVLGILSKPMVVTLPVILLLLDYWPLRRLSWWTFWEKVPLFALAAGSCLVTLTAQKAGGALAQSSIFVGDRITNAFFSYVKYFWLTLWPVGLSPWYSHPALEGDPLSWWMVAGSIALIVGISAFALSSLDKRPYVAVGWLWYLITLLPVIGLIQVSRQGLADRYLYIPQVGLLILIIWSAAELPIWKARRRVIGAVAIVLMLGRLGLATRKQVKVWSDDLTFWTSTAESNPSAFIAHHALAIALNRHRRFDEALHHYQIATQIRPDVDLVHFRIGGLLARKGELEEAAKHYVQAVQLKPNSWDYRQRLAALLRRQGRFHEALDQLQKASELNPRSAQIRHRLGRLHRALGELEEAEQEFRNALELKPDLGAARQDLNSLLRELEQGMTLNR